MTSVSEADIVPVSASTKELKSNKRTGGHSLISPLPKKIRVSKSVENSDYYKSLISRSCKADQSVEVGALVDIIVLEEDRIDMVRGRISRENDNGTFNIKDAYGKKHIAELKHIMIREKVARMHRPVKKRTKPAKPVKPVEPVEQIFSVGDFVKIVLPKRENLECQIVSCQPKMCHIRLNDGTIIKKKYTSLEKKE
ncbi:MAG: hypothetical protein Hyperionvirus10_51 [Hyperionvirus sp.]|uniref:Uncharacterized protein n=1 Tax=Hyperionvirus sp. TaxID=2487770 RepID=A0A3G5A904_9VIRU|nr:MAG: hypothetical protein Hyperionvirus10_51 [Hyperionvirus sp.]